MGYIRHHAIIVTSWRVDLIKELHEQVLQIVEDDHDIIDLHITSGADLVSAIHFSPSNSYASFVIFPDGSKEGWNTSDRGDAIRGAVIKRINSFADVHDTQSIDWVEIQYGDEEGNTAIVRHSDEAK